MSGRAVTFDIHGTVTCAPDEVRYDRAMHPIGAEP